MLLSLNNSSRPFDLFDNILNGTIFNQDYSEFVLENNQYNLEIPLAGFKKENIDITTNQNTITVKADRKNGQIKYEKTYYLPKKLDFSEVKAKLEEGLLTITFEKENKKLENKIKIN